MVRLMIVALEEGDIAQKRKVSFIGFPRQGKYERNEVEVWNTRRCGLRRLLESRVIMVSFSFSISQTTISLTGLWRQ
jgi:hypothetical protein